MANEIHCLVAEHFLETDFANCPFFLPPGSTATLIQSQNFLCSRLLCPLQSLWLESLTAIVRTRMKLPTALAFMPSTESKTVSVVKKMNVSEGLNSLWFFFFFCVLLSVPLFSSPSPPPSPLKGFFFFSLMTCLMYSVGCRGATWMGQLHWGEQADSVPRRSAVVWHSCL